MQNIHWSNTADQSIRKPINYSTNVWLDSGTEAYVYTQTTGISVIAQL